MISNKEDAESKIDDILIKLRNQSSVFDQKVFKEIQFEILILTKETVIWLNEGGFLTPWAKDRIFYTIDSIARCWLYSAITNLESSFSSSELISPDNKYVKEITDLNIDDFLKSISKLEGILF